MDRLVELAIEDIAFGGKGVGRAGGKVFFVPFTIDGERVEARITKEKKSFGEGKLLRLIEPSTERVNARCPYFGRCGGCSYQHMLYEHQLHWKAQQVKEALRRIGKINEPPMRPIVSSPREYEYRNRITVHVEDGIVGFFRYDAHRLLDIVCCPIARPEVNEQLRDLRARSPRDGHYTLRAQSGPRVFFQTNDDVGESLAHAISELIPPQQDLLIDAYCGAGFFGRRLAKNFRQVIGFDWDVHAITAARTNATENEDYIAGDIATHLRSYLDAADLEKTTIIVDPPAIGLSLEVRQILQAHPAARLLYVSCNPPTLARDLADVSQRFELQSVTPFDMFPQTAEIEVLAHLVATR